MLAQSHCMWSVQSTWAPQPPQHHCKYETPAALPKATIGVLVDGSDALNILELGAFAKPPRLRFPSGCLCFRSFFFLAHLISAMVATDGGDNWALLLQLAKLLAKNHIYSKTRPTGHWNCSTAPAPHCLDMIPPSATCSGAFFGRFCRDWHLWNFGNRGLSASNRNNWIQLIHRFIKSSRKKILNLN